MDFNGGLQDKKRFEVYLKSLHDQYRPQAIFMTQTSSVAFGYAIKELWRKAWPDEKQPAFLTIDVRPVMNDKEQNQEISEGTEAHKRWQEIDRANRSRELSFYENILTGVTRDSQAFREYKKIVDDLKSGGIMGQRYGPDYLLINNNPRTFRKIKDEVKSKLSSHHISGNIAIVDENHGFRGRGGPSLGRMDRDETPIFEPDPVNKNYTVSSNTLGTAKPLVEEAQKELGISSKVIVLGLGYERQYHGPWHRDKSVTESVRYKGTDKDSYPLVKKTLADYKQFGRELGQELHDQIQSQKSLEQRASSTTAVLAFIGSLFFTTSNLTGDAIGTLSTSTTNLIGIILFLIGIVGTLFYIKSFRKIDG